MVYYACDDFAGFSHLSRPIKSGRSFCSSRRIHGRAEWFFFFLYGEGIIHKDILFSVQDCWSTILGRIIVFLFFLFFFHEVRDEIFDSFHEGSFHHDNKETRESWLPRELVFTTFGGRWKKVFYKSDCIKVFRAWFSRRNKYITLSWWC